VDTIEQLRSGKVSNQKIYIELQEKLIQKGEHSKSVQIESSDNAQVLFFGATLTDLTLASK
jgi:hypothetical protein